MVERFNIKTETKLLKALSEIFNEETENMEVPDSNLFYMDNVNVVGIECKTERMKHLFIRFTDKHRSISKLPHLDFRCETRHLNLESKSCYAIDYLKSIINIFVAYGFETVKISLLRDYPVSFECDDFRIILAPRIDE